VVKTSNRLAYLDWMRGLGVLIMLQGHVFESWVRPQDRSGEWFWLSQFLGGLPAPIFLFLVGVSLALVLDRMRSKGTSAYQLSLKVLRRSGWILFLAYAFRLEQYVMWYPASIGSDVFRIDTLNCIAICTLIVGLLSIALKSRRINLVAMAVVTTAFAFLTPLIYPAKGLPSFVLSYVNGGGHPWYFSFFPWAAFTFAGITFGYALLEGKQLMGEPEFFKHVAVAGITVYAIGVGMSLTSIFEYGFFDYSLTSPHFFFVRLGWVLLILYGAYMWSTCKAAVGWSPLITLGQASLVVYWLHMEIVYGRFFHHLNQSLEITNASMQLLWVVPLMILLASRRQIQMALAPMWGTRGQTPRPATTPFFASEPERQ
jgi:uncharacterized membrane protein